MNISMFRKIAIITAMLLPFVAIASIQYKDNKLFFETKSWSGILDPATLTIKGQLSSAEHIVLADCPTNLGDIRNFFLENKRANWYYPQHDTEVTAFLKKERLVLQFKTNREQKFLFPRTGQDKRTKSIIYPDGEGLFIPNKDPFWKKRLANTSINIHEELTMPFWGHYFDNNTVTFILENDLNNKLHFLENDNLYVQLEHDFKNNNTLEIQIILSPPLPIQPALEYRKYLKEQNKLVTLKQKAEHNKEIEKLYGAIHFYLWGNGRSIDTIKAIKNLGIDNAWLGYDQDPRLDNNLVTSNIIKKAKDLGYLIGPYDSFHTMQDPRKADSMNTIFDNLYPDACIINHDGKMNVGFGGKGCHISSEALILQKPKNKTIYNRIDKFIETGINSYFLDCDATGELFDDYSDLHPMTQEKDRLNRIERMNYISSEKKLVLGSETASAWAVPFIAFAHGNFSVHNAIHWELIQSKKYGNWWPQERPNFFFKQIQVPDEYIKAKYDPRYRIPLFQAVFHDCIITTDRWELSHMKIANAVNERELLELLYGVPSIWALDLKDINKYKVKLKKINKFFSPLHKAIATEELKNFVWLDKERKIQQTTFGNKVRITANFSDIMFNEINPKTIELIWLYNNHKEYYTP